MIASKGMPCKSTTKLGNLPEDLQSFELGMKPYMNRRWKVLMKDVDELQMILIRFQSLIGFDPFEHQIIKIHRIYNKYTPFLKEKTSSRKILAQKKVDGRLPKIDPLLHEAEKKPKSITTKYSKKLRLAQLEENNLSLIYHYLLKKQVFEDSEIFNTAHIRSVFATNQEMLAQITRLNLSKLKLTYLPKELLFFKKLRVLNIAQNQLEFLPDWIGELQDLESINLSKNRLYNLPPTFYKLKKLKTIFIHSNKLTHVPLRLSHLPLLKRLIS